MQRIKKLKPDRDFRGPLPLIFAAVIGGCSAIFFGPRTGLDTLGVIVLVYATFALIAAIRTFSVFYWVQTIYLYCLGTYIIFLEIRTNQIRTFALSFEAKFLFVWVLFFLIWMLYLIFTRRAKWRGRDIMEAAAEDVETGESGHTNRPKPIAKIEYTKDELFSFAQYLKKNLVVMPYYDHEKVIFVPVKMGEEYGILFGPNVRFFDRTWISFDFYGNVSVFISKDYYLDYKENLSSGQLCDSLGNLFIRFFEQYKNGEEVRIIDHLNDMKVGLMS